jgi:hypothetical protein
MAGQPTYYDVLGVQSGASADEVQRSYDMKMAVLAPGMISGAPSKIIAATDRARAMLDVARRTLIDPAARRRYDIDVGILRPDSGLVRRAPMPSEPRWDPFLPNLINEAEVAEAGIALVAEALAPHRRPPRHVLVPDARGLFVGPARRLMTLSGLRADLVQLTVKPMPVEGIVVDQSARPGARVRRSSTVMMQVWHPTQQIRR